MERFDFSKWRVSWFDEDYEEHGLLFKAIETYFDMILDEAEKENAFDVFLMTNEANKYLAEVWGQLSRLEKLVFYEEMLRDVIGEIRGPYVEKESIPIFTESNERVLRDKVQVLRFATAFTHYSEAVDYLINSEDGLNFNSLSRFIAKLELFNKLNYTDEDQKYFKDLEVLELENLKSLLNTLSLDNSPKMPEDEQLDNDLDNKLLPYKRGDQTLKINLLHQFGILEYLRNLWTENNIKKGDMELLISKLINSDPDSIRPRLSNKDDPKLRNPTANERLEDFLDQFGLSIDKIKSPIKK